MNALNEKTLVPIGLTVAAVLTFGAASFKVGALYNQIVADSSAVQIMSKDVATIKTDLVLIRTDIQKLTPPSVSFRARKPAVKSVRKESARDSRQARLIAGERSDEDGKGI